MSATVFAGQYHTGKSAVNSLMAPALSAGPQRGKPQWRVKLSIQIIAMPVV